jgi:hypothetical protein
LHDFSADMQNKFVITLGHTVNLGSAHCALLQTFDEKTAQVQWVCTIMAQLPSARQRPPPLS